ncbi:MAG: serine/threonine protein kinase [Labilithrix sp.]|nr:serine/threonine protein kinase [Labilithrix sp.]
MLAEPQPRRAPMTQPAIDKSPSITSGMLLAGKYRIERLLGEGGMGVVLAATNEALRQRVAIKLLRSATLANEKALGRFEREARAAARLRSEHVARVLDVGKLEDGRPYMVMEYLEGQDLGDLIDHGPSLSVTDTVDYVLQACEAVAEAHAAGIIHRDLKPRNLFLAATVDGRPLVKVLDFGISKDDGANGAEDMSLTRTTEIIGSPSYMSPEQLRASKEVDVRTDIWALGVILYELLTKKVPFQAVTVTDLVAVVLMDPTPDVRVDRPDVPDGVAYAIHRCLEKRREERFSSVAELVGALAPFASAHYAGMGERVLRVAQGSSRGLPPSDTGSGPYAHAAAARGPSQGPGTGPLAVRPSGQPGHPSNVPAAASSARVAVPGHGGGTSVAWGETQVEPGTGAPRASPSRAPLVLAALLAVIVLGLGGTGAVLYTRHARASASTAAGSASPPGEAIPLPAGRKDLPASTAAVTAAPPSSAAASSLPEGRVPVTAAPPSKPAPAAKPGAKTTPPTPAAKPDDLSNIGRR